MRLTITITLLIVCLPLHHECAASDDPSRLIDTRNPRFLVTPLGRIHAGKPWVGEGQAGSDLKARDISR
jgi:hypothetical protein